MKLLLWLALLSLLASSNSLTIKSVERKIDLTTQFSKQTLTFNVENAGSLFEYPVQSHFHSKLASISAQGSNGKPLTVSKADVRKDAGGFQLYNIHLAGNSEFSVDVVYTHTMTPHPAEIDQTSPQFMKYSDNLYVFSLYPSKSQTTTVKLASATVESFSEFEPFSQKGDTIEYGPYEDVSAFAHKELDIHFQSHAPFLTVNSLIRDFEISHWGNLAVEEHYKIVHSGAKHVGPFSRWTHFTMTRQGQTIPAVLKIDEKLPLSAGDIYYRDEIGNISSSFVSQTEDATLLELVPRYPLLGGWSIGFYLGYNVPLGEFLSRSYSTYVLNVSLVPQIENVVFDHVEIRVIMPEGARNFEVFASTEPASKSTSKLFTYLDVTGRPVQVIEFTNVVFRPNDFIQVSYQFSSFNLFFEPLLLLVGYFSLFIFAILFVRLDFLFGQTRKSEKLARVETEVDEAKGLYDELKDQFELLEDAFEKRTTLKINDKQYNDERDNVKKQATSLLKRLGEVALDISKVDEGVAERVKKLRTALESKLTAQLTLYHTEVVERKTMAKTQYETKKNKFSADLKAAAEEASRLFSELSD